MTRLEPGTGIGDRYTLVAKIGSGGMADVWAADDSMLGRRVALKFMHERFAQDASFVERFKREAQAAAGLQHPNVVSVYDRGEWEGRPWIAMEYVEGASLSDLIKRGLSVGEAVEIVRQVLAGARFAHGRGIVHRDLKPGNVIVDPEGRARVLDWGIARGGGSEITATGSVLGTAQYLSPEQAQGLEVTAASDIYSIGVILYEALTGRVPFEAETPVAVALKQVSEQPRPPSQVNPNVPPALDTICLRALAKEPGQRFASADEFLRALDAAEADPSGAALAPAPVPVPPPTAVPQRRWLSRRRVAVLAAILLLAGAGAAFALTRPERVTVPAVIEKPRSEAESLLRNRGFEVSVATAEFCAAPNTVTDQNPPAGTEVDEGSRVTITVSLGFDVAVPQTRGMEVAEATRRLQQEDLIVDARERPSKGVRPGRVIGTEPPAGTQVECQSDVTLLVSKGPTLVTLPDVLGEQEETARAELERLGFIVDVDPEDSDEPEGTVIGEDPGGGSELRKGERITLIVSTGAGSVIVPDVVGQPEETAIDTLAGRGALNIQVIEQETDEESDDGRVLEQAPSPGTRIRAGDQVTIFVGEFVPPDDIEVQPGPQDATETPK
jgi:beta-lactam-binding protein with PASTA domain/tRNA A-37 threonylcarbamoyl transferase component Bud32